MDSPVEFGPVTIETFTIGPRTFRFAAHQTAPGWICRRSSRTGEDRRAGGSDLREFPPYEPGFYTFLADYLPANGDGMEHRNSTVMTSPGSIVNARRAARHRGSRILPPWNVERIARAASSRSI
jgi:predicted metalloprotease with PDZ domain